MLLNTKKTVLLAAALFCCAFPALAQRTAQGTFSLSASAVWSFSGLGGELGLGLYDAGGMWKFGVSDANRTLNINDGAAYSSYMHLEACADHLWRIAGTRDRAFSLYGGGGVFLGMEMIDPSGRWPEGYEFPYNRSAFLYGIDGQLELEWFFIPAAPGLGLVLDGRLPVNFSSQIRKLCPEVSLGLRYCF